MTTGESRDQLSGPLPARREHHFNEAHTCTRCGIARRLAHRTAGCQAEGINQFPYFGFALTPAEQELAEARSLRQEDALEEKTRALRNEGFEGYLFAARKRIELRALRCWQDEQDG